MRIRCPHCHNPVEIVEDDFSDISCPSCGSRFSLISGDTTTAAQSDQTRTIGHFELIHQVGVGAFGSVWKARDKELDRIVAVKIPRRDQLSAAEVDVFFRGARAAAQVKHPGIVGTHEVGRDGETIYIVSDFVDGADLKQWLSSQRLSAREAAELVAKVATALHHAHEAGVIHRDLKPGNIMLDLAGEPHITDFGLAKRESGEISITLEGKPLGTPNYMPPEQAKGKGHHADRRSDVYSLGVILFELLTGEVPFRGEAQMVLMQIQKDEPPRPRKLNAKIPRDLETITLKCLEKDPAKRYPTSQALADDLRNWLEGKPILARPITRVARGWRWCKRNRTVAVLAAAVALALASGTSVSSYFAIRASAQAFEAITERNRADENAGKERLARKEAEASAEEARREKDAARKLHYRADMNLAQRAWDESQFDYVFQLLAQHKPHGDEHDQRGWEWFYQERLLKSELRTIPCPGGIISVVFSPDGRQLASGNADGTIRIWSADTGRELRRFMGHSKAVISVAFSPDGQRIASASADETIKLWNVASGTVVRTIEMQRLGPRSVRFSPDGRRLASANFNYPIKIWDAETGAELRSFGHRRPVECISFSSDGRRLASAGLDQMITLWDLETGTEIRTLQGHKSDVLSVAFSPDGLRLSSASKDKTIKLWNAETGALIRTLNGHSGACYGVSFSPDGNRLASVSFDRTIKLWDAVDGSEIRSLVGHLGPVLCVSFSPDGRRLASASYDQTIKIWDAEFGAEFRTLDPETRYVKSISFSPDGRQLASPSSETAVMLWDTESGAGLRKLRGHTSAVQSVVFSPVGNWLASAGFDKTVKLWDVKSGAEVRTFKGHSAPVKCVSFHPDGTRLASASEDSTIKLWNVATGLELLTLKENGAVHCVSFSPDGQQLASASEDGTINLWNPDSGSELRRLKGEGYAMNSLSFSPDSRRLASVSPQQPIKVWDVTTGEVLLTLKGHAAEVQSVSFNRDGRRLASASSDHTIKIWDAETGAELRSLNGDKEGVYCVAFDPDGRRLASSGATTIKLWNTDDLTPDEKMARTLVDELFAELSFSDEVIVAIQSAESWNEQMKQAGILYASSRSNDAASVYATTWDFVTKLRYLERSADKWNRVKRVAGILVAKEQDNAKFRRLLALTHCQLGEASQALKVLSVNPSPDPSDLLLQAIAQYELGNGHKAVSAVEAVRLATDSATILANDESSFLLNFMVDRCLQKSYFANVSLTPPDWPNDQTLLENVLALGLGRVDVYRQLGDSLAMQDKWRQAADAYAKAAEIRDRDWSEMSSWALLQLAANDETGYRATATELLQRHGGTSDPYAAYWIALTCVLTENASPNLDRVVALAHLALKEDPKNPVLKTALGAAQLRTEKVSESITTLKAAIPQHVFAELASPEQVNSVRLSRLLGETILATAYHKQGNTEDLRAQIDTVLALIERLESLPPQFRPGLSPWALRFGIVVSKREIARLEARQSAAKE